MSNWFRAGAFTLYGVPIYCELSGSTSNLYFKSVPMASAAALRDTNRSKIRVSFGDILMVDDKKDISKLR